MYFSGYDPSPNNTKIENTVIGLGSGGSAIACSGSPAPTLLCCDIFGNSGGDWQGPIASQYGCDGNCCTAPRFCDPDVGDFGLLAFSPLVAMPGCGRIGALGVGCGLVAVKINEPEPDEISPEPDEVSNEPDVESGDLVTETDLFCSLTASRNTEIGFALPEACKVRITIHDVLGRRIATVADEERAAGRHVRIWDRRTCEGSSISPGVYFVRLETPDRVLTRRMVVLQ
jgi:hypothetical protein